VIVLSERARRLLDTDQQIEAKVRKAVRRMGDGAAEGGVEPVGEIPERELLDRLISRVRRL
jgi:hypothetical protein